jgi:hypothetical protein
MMRVTHQFSQVHVHVAGRQAKQLYTLDVILFAGRKQGGLTPLYECTRQRAAATQSERIDDLEL